MGWRGAGRAPGKSSVIGLGFRGIQLGEMQDYNRSTNTDVNSALLSFLDYTQLVQMTQGEHGVMPLKVFFVLF